MILPKRLVRRLDRVFREQLFAGGADFDFSEPRGEAGLAGADSVSWRVFRNPLALYIGGITAVLLELAEPRVRTGVWEHTSFRSDPLRRMRRTGLAAMVTVYGARSRSEKMIAGVGRMHGKIQGETPAGVGYRADDPELLRWVHATALYGFMEAYHRYVRLLSADERDRFVAEGVPAAKLYGAEDPPGSVAEMRRLFSEMQPKLERSEILGEFLGIMRGLELFPKPLRPVGGLMVRAAVDLLPVEVRGTIGLDGEPGVPAVGDWFLRRAGFRIDRLQLDSSPAARSCVRLGLPADYLLPR